MERIVVSGGSDGKEQMRYNFIETAIKCIIDWQANSDEAIMWVIANWRYKEDDIDNFRTVAGDYGVGIMVIDDKQVLFDYMNDKKATEQVTQ